MTSTFVDRRAWAALALLGCLFASPGAARADAGPSAEDVVVLRDRGELQPAIEKLRVAYTIIPTPVTAVELGKAYVLAGRILDARELFLSVRRIAVHPEETARSQSAREEAARAALELEPRIPSLLVSLELAKGATAAVTIDDAPVLVDALKDPRKMNPGHHVVVINLLLAEVFVFLGFTGGQVSRAERDRMARIHSELHLVAVEVVPLQHHEIDLDPVGGGGRGGDLEGHVHVDEVVLGRGESGELGGIGCLGSNRGARKQRNQQGKQGRVGRAGHGISGAGAESGGLYREGRRKDADSP
jgi:hypothetical protein